MEGRAWTMRYARSLVGSHYLWGAGGATPDSRNGVFYRQGGVGVDASNLDPASPSVFAANCTTDGYCVCAGRFRNIPGGRYARSSDWDLKNYLSMLDDLGSESRWYPYYARFTPRVVKGGFADDAGKIVWGEDCMYIRHFDCISFINFVLTKTTNPDWWASVQQYGRGGLNGLYAVEMSEPPADADILVRYGSPDHIGLLGADGRVIQAQNAAGGVHADERYAPGKWSARLRLPDDDFWF